MSDYTVKIVMGRIKIATAESPIAVFGSEKQGYVRAVFGSTVQSHREIAAGNGLIGVYTRDDHCPALAKFLDSCAGELVEKS